MCMRGGVAWSCGASSERMRVVVGVAEEYWDVSRMSQALRIDPTMIETYSAMLFVDRSELFGAEKPRTTRSSRWKPEGRLWPSRRGLERMPVIGSTSTSTSTASRLAALNSQKKVYEEGELTVVSCRDMNTLVHVPTCGQGMTAPIR